jgi:hypothetical protein
LMKPPQKAPAKPAPTLKPITIRIIYG